MNTALSLRSAVRVVVVFIVGSIVVLGSAGVAAAHVNFVGSVPANVSTVQGPVTQVTLEYSGAADPITSDFLIEDATGATVPIASVKNDGEKKVVVTSKTPLPAGRNKVTWALRGTDGHKMSGTITFTVTAPPPSSQSSSTPSTTAGAAPTTIAVPPTVPSVATVDAGVAATSTSSGPDTQFAETIATFGRWLVYAAILFVVGAFAYLVWVHRGSRGEGRRIVFLIRRGALVIVIGAIVEWFAQLAVDGSGSLSDLFSPGAWSDLLTTGFAIGTALRIVGAVLVLRFVSIDVVAEDPIDFADLDGLDMFGELSSTGGVMTAVDTTSRSASLARVRVESGPLAFVGALLLIASESFIGHTASVGPRALVLVSDAAHMTAAGVWASGVWLLCWTLWQRSRRGERLDARMLATRFSIVATWALVIVALTGTALGWAILRSPSHVLSTEFGQLLLVKVAAVGVIAAIGLHNRRTLIPALDAPGGEDRFRRTLVIESVLFVAVLIVTALLVVANPLP